MSFLESDSAFYADSPRTFGTSSLAVTAAEALSDLPPITTHLDGTLKRVARHFDQFTAVLSSIWHEFQTNWEGMALLSEEKLRTRMSLDVPSSEHLLLDIATETEGTLKIRTMQSFLRKVVLADRAVHGADAWPTAGWPPYDTAGPAGDPCGLPIVRSRYAARAH